MQKQSIVASTSDACLLPFANGEDQQTNTPKHAEHEAHSRSNTRNASRLVDEQIRYGGRKYQRQRDLPGLLHLFPSEIRRLDHTDDGAILRRIIQALRAERLRGRSGHWRYSLQRHIGLMQARTAEKLRFLGETEAKLTD